VKRLLPAATAALEDLLEFTEIKLVVMDVDGTMLNSGSGVTSQLVKLMRTPHGFDVDVTIATGRAYAGGILAVRHLNPRRIRPIIVYNGAMIIDPASGHIVDQNLLDEDVISRVIDVAVGHGLSPLVYDCIPAMPSGGGTSSWPVVETVFGFAANDNALGVRDPNGLPVDWSPWDSSLDRLVGPVAVVIPTIGLDDAAANLRHDLRSVEGLSVTGSSSKYIEIRPAGVDKSTALRKLARMLHLAPPDVAAVGDNDNDIEMLRWAGIGVAVAGSSPLAMAACDYESRFRGAGGVAELFQVIRHARRYAGAVGTPR
jgi:hydroxymethylpyrimidine pyrophosphatase-like HAD family hydrolase